MSRKRKTPGPPAWYRVLEAAREISQQGERPFTARELADAASIEPGARSSPRHIASGWLSKFVRWGYVLHAGTVMPEAQGVHPTKRWIRAYQMTKFGLTCPLTDGTASRLGRLAAACRDYEAARNGKDEERSWKELLHVLGEVDPGT